ncbi:hypothetical protein [Gorillibacterium sp. sgz5001074]|uniref:hypothetical protein n=1 Tax=Gorillibacterium sp. sgz5001074 TaxID=3446695 RepID=UPI003F67C3A9
MPATDGNRILFHHEGDLTGWTVDRVSITSGEPGLFVYRTENTGGSWSRVRLPIEENWEAEADQDQILASFALKNPSWILLQSKKDGGGSTRKALYARMLQGRRGAGSVICPLWMVP